MIGIINRIFKRKRKTHQDVLSFDLNTLRGDISRLSRELLESELFKFSTAYTVSQETSKALNLEKTLNILVDRIAQIMSVEIVSLMLIGKNNSELLIKFAKGLNNDVVENVKVKLGEGISGWVAQTGQSLLIKDITKDSRFNKRSGKYSTNSLLSVPLKIGNNVIGVINVNNKESRKIFDEEDLDILTKVIDLATLVVVIASLKEDAKELDALRSKFIANVSHELRTPLTALKEAIGIILDEIAGSINDKQRRFLSLATKNIDRLGRLIDNILDFSKVEAETKEIKRTLFDVGEMVGATVLSFKPLADKQNIKIKSFLPKRKIDIWGDNDKLHEVITNFVDNAIKYNRRGGKVEVKLEDAGDNARIHVSDTGVGIPEGEMGKIFDRFNRIKGNFKENVKSNGLGLSIVKDIVEMHGGQIAVESKEEKGSKFTITLPKNLRVRR